MISAFTQCVVPLMAVRDGTPGWFLPLLAAAGGAFLLARLFLPALMKAAGPVGAVDVPADGRRMHKAPVPRTGGIAVFLAFYAALPLASLPVRVFMPLLAGSLVVLVGIWDDVYRLPPLPKLCVQLAAAGFAAGTMMKTGGIPLFAGLRNLPGIRDLPGVPETVQWLAGVLFLTALANAHNMIDGVDGLCGSVSLAEGAGLTALLLLQGKTAEATAAGMLCAVLPAFLHFNRHPARVFLGDTGSATFGFLLGAAALWWEPEGALAPLVLPTLFALPLSDLGFAVFRRMGKGESPFAADRGHWHHRLTDRGFGQVGVCGWLAALSFCGVLLALSLARPEWYACGVFFTLWGAGLMGGLWLVTEKFVHPLPETAGRKEE